MTEASKTCDPTTSGASPNAISSPASECGPWPCEALGGLTTRQFGACLAPANLSARQAKAMGLLTSGTCGPRPSTLSLSSARSALLASRLRPLTDSLGSTLYKLTWKVRVTPQGRSIHALRGSAHRTCVSGFIGMVSPWATPGAGDDRGAQPIMGGSGGPTRGERDKQTTWVEGPMPSGHMADAGRTGLQFEHRPGEALGASGAAEREARERQRGGLDAGGSGPLGHMADTHGGLARHEREQRGGEYGQLPANGGTGDMANPASGGRGVQRLTSEPGRGGHLDGGYAALGMDNASGARLSPTGQRLSGPVAGDRAGGRELPGVGGGFGRPGPVNGAWGTADWLLCTDGKWRPVEPGTFPLAYGSLARSGRLRAYGNAINLEAAKGFLSVALAT